MGDCEGGGLEIHIQFVGKNVLRLGLARADVFPSSQEWETVIDFWPEENTSVTGAPHEAMDADRVRMWLVGELTIARQLELI